MKHKKTLFWILAVLITLFTAVYQRMTGPTYPKSISFEANGKSYKFHLPRSVNGYMDALITLDIPDPEISGLIVYRHFPTSEPWDTIRFARKDSQLIAWLPKQPAAGKLEYRLKIFNHGEPVEIKENENIVIRFKSEVPAWVLIPHILLIFTAMLLSNLTGLFAMAGLAKFRFYTGLTLIMFILGGMLMGPVVQKFAFGEFWTGFPFGKDLTDNKSLIAFVLWIIAWVGNRKKERRYLVIAAALVNLAIAFVPHSLGGSELDYNTGEIKTGMMFLNGFFL
jgi:hypothetical protein